MRFSLLSLVPLAACAEPEPAVEAETLPAGCLTSFSADVREGPDAGLAVRAVLFLTGEEEATGARLAAGGAIEVDIAVDGDAVELDIPTAAGTIEGTGTLDYTPAECEGEMLGDLVGPAEGDAGDWAGQSGGPVPWTAEDTPAEAEIDACLYELRTEGATLDGALVLADAEPTVGFFVPAGASEAEAPPLRGVGDRGAGSLAIYDGVSSAALVLDEAAVGCPDTIGATVDGAAATVVRILLPATAEAKAASGGAWTRRTSSEGREDLASLTKDYEEVGTESGGGDGEGDGGAPAEGDELVASVTFLIETSGVVPSR